MDNSKFKNISIEDKHIIEQFTYNSCIDICDFAFVNMLGWGQSYGLAYALINDSLVLRFINKITNKHIYLPIVSSDKNNVVSAINEILVSEKNIIMASVPLWYRQFLADTFKDKFSFLENRNGYDYIYEINSLKSLSGKKLQSKRNHINKFKQLYPQYNVVDITDDNISECIELSEKWFNDHIHTESAIIEQKMITFILKQREKLGLLAIAIEVDGHIVAFSAGSPINKDTFGVHIEKADASVNGAFTIVNKEFCNRIPEVYKYVNREEDMGIDGLRQSKMSYHPYKILEKDIVEINL